MGTKKSGAKELFWRDLVNRQPRSGLSIRAFCVEEGVSEPSFFGWRKRLQAAQERAGQLGTTSRAEQVAVSGREFIPLELIESPPALEVIHPRGYRVRVTGRFDAADLARLFDVLDGRSNA